MFPIILWIFTPESARDFEKKVFEDFDIGTSAFSIISFVCGVLFLLLMVQKKRLVRYCGGFSVLLLWVFIVKAASTWLSPSFVPDEIVISPPASGEVMEDPKIWENIQANIERGLPKIDPKSTLSVQMTSKKSTTEQFTELESPHKAIITFFGSGAAVTATLQHRYHFMPFAMLCDSNGSPAQYKAVWVMHKTNFANQITNWTDFFNYCKTLNVRPKIGFGDQYSTSSYRVPLLALRYADIKFSDIDYQVYDSQHALLAAIEENKVSIGCVASDVLDREAIRNWNEFVNIKCLEWGPDTDELFTNSFPSGCIGWRNDIDVPYQLLFVSALANNTSPISQGAQVYHLEYCAGVGSSTNQQTGEIKGINNFFGLWNNAIKVNDEFNKQIIALPKKTLPPLD